MLAQNMFLKKYSITLEDFKSTGFKWTELEEIEKNYLSYMELLEPQADTIADNLRAIPQVHSVKFRIKDPEHLIAKIIRKQIADNNLSIDRDNYRQVIFDLIGVRALHLFKNDWKDIHNYVVNTWDLKEITVANVRSGDSENIIRAFKEKGCEINEHPYGYRSIHYTITVSPDKGSEIIAEIQVRTIFEEGWSEIDHQIRYPYSISEPLLEQFLVIFNRLAGSADEMGSFIRILKNELEKRSAESRNMLEENNRMIGNLRANIAVLKMDQGMKENIQKTLDKLSQPSLIAPAGIYDWSKYFGYPSKVEDILGRLDHPLDNLYRDIGYDDKGKKREEDNTGDKAPDPTEKDK
ncbi:MAG: GTP pyrophosphokinase [bacterium]|nr:GTP pyrophosphokinase [bacterium]